MRTKGEIVQKYKQRRYRHLAKVLRRNLSRRCHNCQYNAVHTDSNSTRLSYCWYGQEQATPFTGVVCDDRLDGGEQVRDCPVFSPVSRETLVSTFELSLSDPETIVAQYPDLAALQWVLGEPVPMTWFARVREYLLVRVAYVFRHVSGKSQEATPSSTDSY